MNEAAAVVVSVFSNSRAFLSAKVLQRLQHVNTHARSLPHHRTLFAPPHLPPPTTMSKVMQGQDWNEYVVRKKPPTAASTNSEKAVNAARRQGASIETVKKFSAGTNSKAGGPQNAARLEEDEDFTVKQVSMELKKQIQKARIAKGWTQSQLAQAINETPRVIQDYENGKAVPNPQVLNKMSRVLGTTLSNKAKPAKK